MEHTNAAGSVRSISRFKRYSPTDWLIRRFSPREDNAAWILLIHYARRRGLTDRALFIAFLAAIFGGYYFFGVWSSFVYPGILLIALYWKLFDIPKRFLSVLLKNGQDQVVLSAPIENHSFADAFLRHLCLTIVFALLPYATFWAVAAVSDTRDVPMWHALPDYGNAPSFSLSELLDNIYGFHLFIAANLWLTFWINSVRGLVRFGEFVKLYFYTILGLLCIVYLIWFPLFGTFGFLLSEVLESQSFFWLLLMGMMAAGLVYYHFIRQNFADRAREKLYP